MITDLLFGFLIGFITPMVLATLARLVDTWYPNRWFRWFRVHIFDLKTPEEEEKYFKGLGEDP